MKLLIPEATVLLNINSERIPRSWQRQSARERQSIDLCLVWKISRPLLRGDSLYSQTGPAETKMGIC
jgi:hypothetical protein